MTTKDQVAWLPLPPGLVPSWCGASATIKGCWKPWEISSLPTAPIALPRGKAVVKMNGGIKFSQVSSELPTHSAFVFWKNKQSMEEVCRLPAMFLSLVVFEMKKRFVNISEEWKDALRFATYWNLESNAVSFMCLNGLFILGKREVELLTAASQIYLDCFKLSFSISWVVMQILSTVVDLGLGLGKGGTFLGLSLFVKCRGAPS